MSISCFLRRHRPMLTSIVQRQNGFTALCDRCGLPIQRALDGRWSTCEPLLSTRDEAA